MSGAALAAASGQVDVSVHPLTHSDFRQASLRPSGSVQEQTADRDQGHRHGGREGELSAVCGGPG